MGIHLVRYPGRVLYCFICELSHIVKLQKPAMVFSCEFRVSITGFSPLDFTVCWLPKLVIQLEL